MRVQPETRRPNAHTHASTISFLTDAQHKITYSSTFLCNGLQSLWNILLLLFCSCSAFIPCSNSIYYSNYLLFQIFIILGIYYFRCLLLWVFIILGVYCSKYLMFLNIYYFRYLLFQIFIVLDIYCSRYLLFQVFIILNIYYFNYLQLHFLLSNESITSTLYLLLF